jgi:hypothetical protein
LKEGLTSQAYRAAGAAMMVAAGSALAQCPSNGGNYVANVSIGSVVPGDTDIGNHGDDVTTPISLPFSWRYYGTLYDTAYVCSNGWVSFYSGSGNGWVNSCLPQTLTVAANNCVPGPAIFPYWDDLRTDMLGGGVYTSVTGMAPHRVFIIEWRAVYYQDNTVPCNFEVRLYEESNRFDVVYGTMGVGGSGGTLGCQQNTGVGSRATQYQCSTTNFNGPAAGTVVSYDCLVTAAPMCNLSLSSSGGFPGDSVVARATITPGSPASPPYTVTLDASQLGAGTVPLYDDGTHGDAVAGDLVYTNTVTVGDVSDGPKTLASTATDSAQPPNSSTCLAAYSIGYCPASTGYTACNPSFEYISNVALGAIDNSSDCLQPGYEDYTALSTRMAPGSSEPITITIGTAWGLDRCTVWVDWNGNGQFTDAGEVFPMSPNPLGTGNSVFNGTITVPLDAPPGARRMRVVMLYSATPVPCPTAAAFTYGNIEDYTINVVACGSADFNCDGDIGTDADIEAFFACLSGSCPAPPCASSADFNGDGDTGTDADIEAFFRVLAGGDC